MKYDYDLIVIGAGSAGLTAAIGGAGIGAKVLLIEKEKIGGDCTHHGCVPSKTLIKAGKVMRNLKDFEKYGLTEDKSSDVDLEKVFKKVQKTVDSIYAHETPEKIKSYGVDVEMGEAMFLDERTVNVNSKHYTSKKFVIATGSRARVPELKGLSDIKYMTNKTVFDPKSYKSILIIGGGPIGCEIGMALNNLGVEVNIANTQDQILGREDKEAAMIVQKKMEDLGVNLYLECGVHEIKTKGKSKIVNLENIETKKMTSLEVDEILVSVGRVPNVEGLNLDKAGVQVNKYGLIVDKYGRTSNKRIYGAGDINGVMQFTHLANAHAKSVLSSTIFGLKSKLETDVIPRVTFTTPEIASVGILEKDKLDSDIVLKKDYSAVDRAITDSDTNGFFKIIVSKKGFVKGATIVGEGAGELIGELSVAMKNKIKITKIADTIHPYPTYGYGLRNTCDLYRSLGYTEKKKKLVQKILRLQGD